MSSRQSGTQPRKSRTTAVVLAAVGGGLLLTLIVCVVASLLLAPPAERTGSASARPSPSVDWSSLVSAAGIPPKPEPATWRAYIDALVAIDPDIVHGKEDKAVDRGRSQCSSIKDSTPDDRARLVDLTNRRFTSPSHPEGFGPEKSSRILDVVHKYICPDW